MINLLPEDLKEQYLYGRKNSTLRKWATGMVFGLIGTILVTFSGLFYMQKSINDYTSSVASTEQTLKDEKLIETQAQATEITGNLKLVVNVLSKEVQFSKLLKQIGSVIPSNTALTDLSISEISGGIELAAVSSDYTSATQLQVNLEDPANKIFSKADILNISCADSATATDKRYPCTIRLRALFSKDNPYLFINQKAPKT